ncbi:MAG: methyltransferase domain-containing protein [bacterium]|nr:methyltransferase domain-containing protein [bacterium]
MYTNQARFNAYSSALRKVVTAESIVLDIGAGTGIFALLACQYGARRVYAIEPDDAVTLAKDLAMANGYADRLTCIQEISTKVTLPERADVIVSDLSGLLPLFQRHIPSIIDARERLLRPGGILIAQRDDLRAAVVSAPVAYAEIVRPWSADVHGLDLSVGLPLVTNTWDSLVDKTARLLSAPSTLAVLDYYTVSNSNVRGNIDWVIDAAASAHGFAIWFDRTVADGITISNQPGAPQEINVTDIYGSGFFPWPRAVALEVGDQVALSVTANLVGSDYVWRWETKIRSGDGTKAHFRQASLEGNVISPASLRKREADYVPTLGEDALLDKRIVSQMDGHRSIGDIARDLTEEFPSHFRSWPDALTRVADVAERYDDAD